MNHSEISPRTKRNDEVVEVCSLWGDELLSVDYVYPGETFSLGSGPDVDFALRSDSAPNHLLVDFRGEDIRVHSPSAEFSDTQLVLGQPRFIEIEGCLFVISRLTVDVARPTFSARFNIGALAYVLLVSLVFFGYVSMGFVQPPQSDLNMSLDREQKMSFVSMKMENRDVQRSAALFDDEQTYTSM